MPASTDAVVFIDNHDNQRGHGGGGMWRNKHIIIWPFIYRIQDKCYKPVNHFLENKRSRRVREVFWI
jgi:hypothetical protein